jgi:hypothetical protein
MGTLAEADGSDICQVFFEVEGQGPEKLTRGMFFKASTHSKTIHVSNALPTVVFKVFMDKLALNGVRIQKVELQMNAEHAPETLTLHNPAAT